MLEKKHDCMDPTPPPLSPYPIFMFAKRGDNWNLSSASKQNGKTTGCIAFRWRDKRKKKSKPDAKEHLRSSIADMDGLFLYM